MNKSKYPQWVLAAADDISDTTESYAAVIWKHAAPEIAGKDIKIGVQTKVIVARNKQIASLQEEIATLKDYSDRWPGNMMDEYQAMQEENERYLNAMTKTVEYFPCGSINAGEIMKLAMEAKTDE